MNTASLPQVASARTVVATVRKMLEAIPDPREESITLREFAHRARLDGFIRGAEMILEAIEGDLADPADGAA